LIEDKSIPGAMKSSWAEICSVKNTNMHRQDVLYFLVWAGPFFVVMRFGCGAHVMGA
jgi:hypothetical protein